MLISLFDSYEEISRLKAVLSESEYELCLLVKLGFATFADKSAHRPQQV